MVSLFSGKERILLILSIRNFMLCTVFSGQVPDFRGEEQVLLCNCHSISCNHLYEHLFILNFLAIRLFCRQKKIIFVRIWKWYNYYLAVFV